MMKLFRLLIVLALFTSLISSVYAMGLTPGRTTLKYESGVTKTVEFSVLNSEGEDGQYVVLIQGELNSSIELSEVSFTMSPSDKEHKVSYSINMPANLQPGTRKAEIVVVKLSKKAASGQTFLGASVGVATQLYINVPYPGKYAESDLNVVGPDDSGKVTFLVPVVSKGDLDLVRVRSVVDVYTSLNEKVVSVESNEIPLASGERGELVAEWKPEGLSPGVYRAVSTLIFDEGTGKVEKTFELGKRSLELQQVEVHDFSLGDIAKFEYLVENKWSQAISGAYLEMLVYNDKKQVIADFKSQTYDVPALSKVLMVAFWDTKGVKEGTYPASVFLKHEQSSQQQDLQLKVSSNEISVIGLGYVISKATGSSSSGSSTLTIVLITIIVVLVLINLLWFLVLRKRLHNK